MMKKNFCASKTLKRIKSIAFVVWLFPKLSETFVLNQMLYFKKQGCKISIFAVKDPRRELAKEDIEFEKTIHADVKKHKFLEVVTYSSIQKLHSLISNKIKKKEIDVVYFQFPDLANKILKHKDFHVPTIVTFHDLPRFRLNKEVKKMRNKYKEVFSKADLILAISNFTKKELIRLGCREHKILIHHMGINVNKFRPQTRKSSEDYFNFTMIGRFVRKKGFEYGIKAFQKIVEKYPHHKLRLHIAGDGILRERLQSEVRKFKLENCVSFYGKMSQRRILQLLRSTQILICPSVTTKEGKREGLPVVILEAAACGIPIIATRHAAIPEVIERGCGVLIKEKSISELEKAMSRMIENYSFYKKKFSEKARQFIKEEHNIRKLGNRLLEILNHTVEIKKQTLAFNNFALYLKKHLSTKVLSAIIVGSVMRREKLSEESDIDILIVFKKQGSISAESLLRLKKGISLLRQESALHVVPQIFNEFDLFQLLSPVLIKSYVKDGEVIYGKNIIPMFRERLSKLSMSEFDTSILKRCLFERYRIRQHIAAYRQKPDYALSYRLAKSVLFLTRDFLYITKGRYVTLRGEIVKTWNNYYKNPVPSHALQIINHDHDSHSLLIFIQGFINYIEEITNRIIKALKKKYPEEQIYISSF